MISKNAIRKAKLRILLGKEDDCVSRILSKKKDENIPIDDQARAVALSECGESKDSKLRRKTATLKLKIIKQKLAIETSTSQDPDSPDFHHFKITQLKRSGYPEQFHNTVREGRMMLASQSEGGKYAKYYLLDSSNINGNGWGVVPETIDKNIQTFVGRPFVITAKDWVPNSPYEEQYDHPFINTDYVPQILQHQEQFRVGNIVKVAKDEEGLYFAMIEIEEKFRNFPLPPFCSPAIYAMNPHEPDNNISEWLGLHLAGLMDEPAYGARIAILKGTCVGTPGSCSHQLRMAKQKKAVLISPTNKAVDRVVVHPETFGKCDLKHECPDKKAKRLKSKLDKLKPLKIKISQFKKKKNKYSKQLQGIDSLFDKDELETVEKTENVTDALKTEPEETKKLKQLDQTIDIKDAKDDDMKNLDSMYAIFKERQKLVEDKQKLEARHLSKKVKLSIMKTLDAISGEKNGG